MGSVLGACRSDGNPVWEDSSVAGNFVRDFRVRTVLISIDSLGSFVFTSAFSRTQLRPAKSGQTSGLCGTLRIETHGHVAEDSSRWQ